MYREVSVIKVREVLRAWLSGLGCGSSLPKPGRPQDGATLRRRRVARGWIMSVVSSGSVIS